MDKELLNTINNNDFIRYFLKIFTKLTDSKMYGSLEIYFENGRPTQITQRLINKFSDNDKKDKKSSKREA